MKLELQSAAYFLVHLIKLGRRNINEEQLKKFRFALVEVLRRRYRDHWFPEKPFKGSGYRCIRINGKMDPVIAQAGESCGLSAALVHSTFPSELTMWVDPLEVSYRIGENGSICVLYEYKEGVNEPWKPYVSISCGGGSSKGDKSIKDSKNSKALISGGDGVKDRGNIWIKLIRRIFFHNRIIDTSLPPTALSLSHPSPPPPLMPPPKIKSSMTTVPCKDSLRKMDYLLDPRKSVSIEQLAAYVSN